MKQIFSILAILLLFCMSACQSIEVLDKPVVLSMKWNGDTSEFQESDNGDMWLSSQEGSGEALVYMPVDGPATGMKYEFDLYAELNPSSANYARVYLWSEEPDTQDPGEAFFVRLGYTKDNVCLCHQTGNKKAKVLITGREGIMNAAASEVSVRVTAEEDGTFHLYTRMEFEDDYTEEGTHTYADGVPAGKGYFMLNCKFTKKGSNAFAFENISVEPLKGGNEPPDDGNDDDNNDDDNNGDDNNNGDNNGDEEPDQPSDPTDDPTDEQPSISVTTPEQEPGKSSYRLTYTLDEEGYGYKAVVYDAAGKSVAEMAQEKTLPLSGTLRWDGKRRDGTYLRPGVYIFYIEFYHTNGKVHRFKKRFIVLK